MKLNRILMMFALAGTMFLAACGGTKLDETALQEVTKFEGDWMAATETLKVLPDQIKETYDATKAGCDSICNNNTCKKESKEKCDSLKGSCKAVHTEMEAMLKASQEKVATLEADGKAFADWKTKVTKGEIKPEDFKKQMEDWNLKVSDINASVTEWTAKLEDLKKQCASNCEDMKSCCDTKKESKK